MLPEGSHIHDMCAVPMQGASLNSFIQRYEYRVKCGDLTAAHRFSAEKEINIIREKQTIDLKSMVENLHFLDENTVQLIVADQGEKKVRLSELLPVIFNVPMQELDIIRVALYGWNSGWVKPLERSMQWTAKY